MHLSFFSFCLIRPWFSGSLNSHDTRSKLDPKLEFLSFVCKFSSSVDLAWRALTIKNPVFFHADVHCVSVQHTGAKSKICPLIESELKCSILSYTWCHNLDFKREISYSFFSESFVFSAKIHTIDLASFHRKSIFETK